MRLNIIKSLKKADFDKFYLRLKQESFNPLEKNHTYLNLANQCGYLFVIYDEDDNHKHVGYFIITPNQAQKSAVIDRFLIFNKYRGKHLTTPILNYVFQQTVDCKFVAVEPIVTAIKFWEKMGFTKNNKQQNTWVKAVK